MQIPSGVRHFISECLGPRFVEPPAADLSGALRDANCATPIILVLSTGADPMADLMGLAEKVNMDRRFEQVSLGQGQGVKVSHVLYPYGNGS